MADAQLQQAPQQEASRGLSGDKGGGRQQDGNEVVRNVLDPTEMLLAERFVNPTYISNSFLRTPALPTIPHPFYNGRMMSPRMCVDEPRLLVCTRLAHLSMNKVRSPVYALAWSRDARRAITGNQSGEFTLWNGMSFHFEGLIAAHSSNIRSLAWSRAGTTLLSGDAMGCLKCWEATMTPVNERESTHAGQAIRGIRFAPSDAKFATGGDDGTLRIWDWERFEEERVLAGHGWDVKCIDWHPRYKMLASGSKDNQVKLWDPRQRTCLATLYGHKHTVMQVAFNAVNGNWLLTSSRDQTLKIYDLRVLKNASTYKGHNREVTACTWHPFNERLFVTGAFDGTINHWLENMERPLHSFKAHDQAVWGLEYHPVGHILCSVSNDHRVRFWSRPNPGDQLQLQPEQQAQLLDRARAAGLDTEQIANELFPPPPEEEEEQIIEAPAPAPDLVPDSHRREPSPPPVPPLAISLAPRPPPTDQSGHTNSYSSSTQRSGPGSLAVSIPQRAPPGKLEFQLPPQVAAQAAAAAASHEKQQQQQQQDAQVQDEGDRQMHPAPVPSPSPSTGDIFNNKKNDDRDEDDTRQEKRQGLEL